MNSLTVLGPALSYTLTLHSRESIVLWLFHCPDIVAPRSGFGQSVEIRPPQISPGSALASALGSCAARKIPDRPRRGCTHRLLKTGWFVLEVIVDRASSKASDLLARCAGDADRHLRSDDGCIPCSSFLDAKSEAAVLYHRRSIPIVRKIDFSRPIGCSRSSLPAKTTTPLRFGCFHI
jgi:hypothetical protein